MDNASRICEGFKSYGRTVIFGASLCGEIAYRAVKGIVETAAFCDNDQKKHGTRFCGISVISPQELSKYADCSILIASMYYHEISYQLSCMEIDRFFIFHGQIEKYTGDNGQRIPYKISEPFNISGFKDITISKETRSENIADYSNFLRKGAERPPFSISTGQINYCEEKNKNILFVAARMPPYGGPGIQRNSKYIKYLKKAGYNPIVVTWGDFSDDIGYRVIDESLMSDMPPDVSVIRIDYPHKWDENLTNGEIAERVALLDGIAGNDALTMEFLDEMKQYNKYGRRLELFFTPWPANALATLDSVVDYGKIGALYTTVPPYDNHFIGFYVKSKHGIPWVADYRDEWTTRPAYEKTPCAFEIALEAAVNEKANAVVMVNEFAIDKYLGVFNTKKDKIHLITNGYDEDDFLNIKPEKPACGAEKFTIIYTGYIYWEINPVEEFFTALNALIDEGSIDAAKIQITAMGNTDANTNRRVKEIDKHNILKTSPYVPHAEMLKSAATADALLLFGQQGKTIYPGKIFEYIRMGIPIYAISDKGGSVDRLITRTRTGVCVDKTDAEGLKKALLEMYDGFFGKGIEYAPDYDEIRKYSRDALTKKLIDVFEGAQTAKSPLSQSPCVLWFTGLSGAGKSTIATELERELNVLKKAAYLLDGDNIRLGLNSDLGFSEADRDENIRRITEVSALFLDAGLYVLVSAISPMREMRRKARERLKGNFVEIYAKASVETCAERDPKGLYKKALNGEIKNFTGISAPYEPPCSPEITLDTESMNLRKCVETVMEYLQKRGL